MRINLLSSFAAGILIATTICGAVYFNDKSAVSKGSSKTTESHAKQPSETEMKTLLTTKGYVIQTKAEYDKSLQDAKGAGQKEAAPDGNQPQKAATKVVVNVTEGMTSIDVGRMLVGANIVQDAFGFSKDIENRGLQNKLHPGTFVVDSDMPIDQVISTIFK